MNQVQVDSDRNNMIPSETLRAAAAPGIEIDRLF